ncbi:hypothetical protein BH10PSE7_BH10PSE7_10230 [soil metagenome]
MNALTKVVSFDERATSFYRYEIVYTGWIHPDDRGAIMGGDATQQRFNDDLLSNEGDLERARILYPLIVHALDHAALRDLFAAYNEPANRAKRRSRRAGLLAVLLGAVSLLIVAASQLEHAYEAHETTSPRLWYALNWIAAVTGIASFVFGAVGVMYANSKRHWLMQRLMTERLRQFHFQSLICRIPDLLQSLGIRSAAKTYVEARQIWFEQFKARHEGKLAAELDLIVETEEPLDFWLHPPPAKPDLRGLSGNAAEQLFSAYRELRLTHQLQYATYKLSTANELLPSLPRGQARLFSNVSILAIVALLLLDLGVITGTLMGSWNLVPSPVLHFITLAVAIVALAVRALEEGLKPEREVERYLHYRSAVRAIRDRYDDAAEPGQKIEIMQEMERLVFDEMCEFLRTHWRSRFVM